MNAASGVDDGAWLLLPPPTPRAYHAAVYDAVRRRMLIFGGWDGTSRSNDTWALSLAGSPHWASVDPTGPLPPPRAGSCAVYDEARDRILIFGGADETQFFGDVWALSLSGTATWTQLTPLGTSPAPRAYATAVYDLVRDRMVLFAGVGEDANSAYSDAWSLSLSGTLTWDSLEVGGAPTGGRWGHTAVFDPVRDRMLVFGGFTGLGVETNDAWELAFTATPTWGLLAATGAWPASRALHAAIYDAARDRMVVHGGYGYYYPFLRYEDAWSLALADVPTWTLLDPAGGRQRRQGCSAIYDPQAERMLVFGGLVDSRGTVIGETWALALSGEPAWTKPVPGSSTPSPRAGHAFIYDPAADRMLLFGGGTEDLIDNEVWVLSPGEPPGWVPLSPQGTPPPARSYHSAVFAASHGLVVFGGGGEEALFNDTWLLSLGKPPSWLALEAPGPPSPRWGHAAVYDPVRMRMLLFGGADESWNYLNDLWALDLSGASGGPAWAELEPVGPAPPGRAVTAAVYDPVRDRLLLYGGYADSSMGDAWELSLSGTPTWSEVVVAQPTPGLRRAASAVYDPMRDRMLLYGGYGGPGPENVYFGDVWGLPLDAAPSWRPLSPAGSPPRPRMSCALAYDPVRDHMVGFGGHNDTRGDTWLSDAWQLSWGAETAPVVTCPGDLSWPPGGGLSALQYSVTNRFGSRQDYDWTLTNARLWPSAMSTGTLQIPAESQSVARVEIEIPDTAEAGTNTFVFGVRLRDVPAVHGSCEHNLHDITTPVLASLVSSAADPGQVRLVWYASGSTAVTATIYRSAPPEGWVEIGHVTSDGSGRLVFEDQQVDPGSRYGYRLGIVQFGREEYFGEVWLDVPRATRLALTGVRPHPATAEGWVSFSLAEHAPATLDLMDVSGRLVQRREVGALGPGWHLVPLSEEKRLDPGLYLLRLRQRGRSVESKAVIIR